MIFPGPHLCPFSVLTSASSSSIFRGRIGRGVGRRPGLASRGAGKENPTADKTQSQKAGAKGGSHTHTHTHTLSLSLSLPQLFWLAHTQTKIYSPATPNGWKRGAKCWMAVDKTFASSPLLLFPPMQIWCVRFLEPNFPLIRSGGEGLPFLGPRNEKTFF